MPETVNIYQLITEKVWDSLNSEYNFSFPLAGHLYNLHQFSVMIDVVYTPFRMFSWEPECEKLLGEFRK